MKVKERVLGLPEHGKRAEQLAYYFVRASRMTSAYFPIK